MDTAGNLFGTTLYGGKYANIDSDCCGTVFELMGKKHQVLYNFCSRPNCADGLGPEAGLVIDASGNLYGTTNEGGAKDFGTVFELSP